MAAMCLVKNYGIVIETVHRAEVATGRRSPKLRHLGSTSQCGYRSCTVLCKQALQPGQYYGVGQEKTRVVQATR